ncbi:MAG: glycosyl transferase family 2, partial [Bacteroidota bacterium]
LTFRLCENDVSTQFIPEAFVYHKRRTSWKQFFKQTFNFGAARPILNKMFPGSAKITFWFPAVFALGLVFSTVSALFGNSVFLSLFGVYFMILFLDATFKNKSLIVGLFSVCATIIQFFGYGTGFLRSFLRLNILGRSKENTFPKMFA